MTTATESLALLRRAPRFTATTKLLFGRVAGVGPAGLVPPKFSTCSRRMANLNVHIPSFKLNDGRSIPVLGYGTGTAWYKGGDDKDIDEKCKEAIKTAIKLGFHHIDGAEVYNTERELGLAIKDSEVAREKLFVTTKVIKNIKDIPNAIDMSLKKLQLDYVDLYLIHSPDFAKSDADLQSAWAAMEKVKESGKAKSIGVSNYMVPQLTATLKTATVNPCVNQIEYHPYLQHGGHDGELRSYMRAHNIAVEAYGPLVPITKAKPGPCDEIFANLAKKYFVSEGEIALRWCIDQDVIPITTSGKEWRMSDYLRCLTFKLTPKEVNEISRLGEKKHFKGYWQAKPDREDRS